MGNKDFRWGIALEKTHGAFLLGANINIGNYHPEGMYGFLCIYLGFRILVVGKDYF